MARPVVQGSKNPAAHAKNRKMPPVVRAILWALITFVVVDGVVSQIIDPFRGHPFASTPAATIGWVFAFLAWILGIGAWEGAVLPLFGIERGYKPHTTGWRRYFEYSFDHKTIGTQYLIFSGAGFFIAGSYAMIFRLELMKAHLWIFQFPGQYLTAVGIHGTVMMFSVATVAMVGGLGNYFVPLMIGAQETVFPKASGLSAWMVPFGIFTVVMSPLAGYWDTGWRGYEPLASQDPGGIVFYYLGVFALTTSSFIVGLNLTSTIIFKRAPGLTWSRVPMFAWGIMVVSLLNVIWLPEIQTTFVLSLLDRVVPLPFFTSMGSPLSYLELFWLFGHPEVYIVVVPALAMWQEIIPVFSRKSLFARQWGVIGLVFVMMLSGLVWAHHMFTNMRNSEMLPFSFFTEMISIPTGFTFLTAIGTMWRSRIRLKAPMILVMMSIFNFLIGGLTGVFNADPVVDLQLHDTFWVVGHFHYTIIGGMVFTWIAAMYYWLPKMSGRMYNEKWAVFLSIWIFIAFNMTFSQFFILGLNGMNRWVAVYPTYLQPMNFEVSLFAFALGIGFVGHAVHVIWAALKGPKAEENPWQAHTLEWTTVSPPPLKNFETVPYIVGGFYSYGKGTGTPVVATAASELAAARNNQGKGGE